jgi:hypothetical protein
MVWGIDQVVDHFSRMHKTLGSIPSIGKENVGNIGYRLKINK